MMTDNGNTLCAEDILHTPGRSLLLIRHGQTHLNREHRFNGHGDPPLNAHGVQQAKALAHALRTLPLTAIWSSPLLRARQTAQPLLVQRDVPLQLDARLMELHQGHLEGQTMVSMRDQYPAFFAAWAKDPTNVRVPGGETMHEVQQRMRLALQALLEQAPHNGPPTVVVSHNMAIAAALCQITKQPLSAFRMLSQRNASVTWLVDRGDGLEVMVRGVRPAPHDDQPAA